MKQNKKRKGFTLLEILLVIAAIGILAAIVLVAINPNRQIAQVRDAQRRSDINTIYKALEQYLIDNKEYPTSINETKKDICISTNTPANCISLSELVPTYLSSIPKDPSGGVYKVYINPENNRIGVEAAGSELGQSIVLNPITIPVVTATGGDITTINQNGIWYKVHTFLTSGTFEVTGGSLNVEYLVVGGGGAGGGNTQSGNSADGGNGGGFVAGTVAVNTSSLAVTVGSGGTGVSGGNGGNGGSSSFSTLVTASGGIGGLGNRSNPTSGGAGGTGTAGGGPVGGTGGAGGAGGTSTITSISTVYAGGGGGGYTAGGLGGIGGGGRGETYSTGNAAVGENGKGGGGGGVSNGYGPTAGKNGGSGIVIVRYVIPAP